jgi:hypothetical protein
MKCYLLMSSYTEIMNHTYTSVKIRFKATINIYIYHNIQLNLHQI